MALQKQFKGLQDLLGDYRGGNLSLELWNGVVPTIDVRQFAEPVQYVTTQGTFSAVGQALVQFVPDDEQWILESITFTSQVHTLATDRAIVVPAAKLWDGNKLVMSLQNGLQRQSVANTGDINSQSWQSDQGLMIYPGGSAGIHCLGNPGGTWNPTYTYTVGYHRIRI